MNIKIKVEALPLHFIILGGFLIIYAILNLATGQYIILSTVLIVVGVLMLTSHQGLLINTDKKIYSEYYWVLGMKLSNYSELYEEIISLECIKGNYSQQYGKYNRRFISGTMYKGYIELSNQDDLFVGQNKSRRAMIKKLTKISVKLQVPLEDNSED
jgi:hypothetical protein